MQGIAVGELRLTGGPGIGKITKFSMREYPGEHARAELVGIAETQESSTAELFGSNEELLGGTVCRGRGAGDLQRDCAAGAIAGGKRLSPASFGAWQRKSADGYGEGKANVSGYIHDLRAGDHPDRIGVGNDGGVSPSAG